MSQRKLSSINRDRLVYPHRTDLFDEVYDAQGEVRPSWQYVMESLSGLGVQALRDRCAKARRILRDDGATYNVYSDHFRKQGSIWGLDLVPSVISSEEWGTIESGLLERAELFNLLLKDLYGPRDLIKHGVLPPELIYSHPGFIRSCYGIHTPGNHELILHAVDMVRGPDGKMCVLTDRTQAPSGAGYALENRTVMSRVLPSLFRDSHVHRLALFFQRLRAKLLSLSLNSDNPQVVVLTPGAHNETYFEHAYIANYLGFPLVQSSDLVVRNGSVWMRSLTGLSSVDVILRRVDDSYCDPVELRADSQLGVPGLVAAARSGKVVIANPLGSGVLENPALLRYLPDISKALLGREPRLATVKTWWCGNSQDLNYVLNNFSNLVVKRIFRGTANKSVMTNQLNAEECDQLKSLIQAEPLFFVAQESITAPHVPFFDGAQLVPRPSILRSFSVASETEYVVMPGGLTRTGAEEKSFLISNQAGAYSKDTWVLASEPERKVSVSPAVEAVNLQNPALTSLPSRVVENLFWMGRYAERAESSLRVMRTVFMLLNGEEPISLECKKYLLEAVTKITATWPGFNHADLQLIQSPDEELLNVVKDANRAGSVRSNLNSMILCADESKELLSSDTLRVINDIRDNLDELDNTLSHDLAAAPEEALDPLVTALMALSGLAHESMTRGIGWKFMEMGRRIERGMQLTSIVKAFIVPVLNVQDTRQMLLALLLSTEILMTYRRRHPGDLDIELGLNLVMLDNSNPRSLVYQLETLRAYLESMPNNDAKGELTPERRALLEADTAIKLSRLHELCHSVQQVSDIAGEVAGEGKINQVSSRLELEQLLNKVNKQFSEISIALSDKYFDHRVGPQQLVSFWGTS